MHEFLEQHPYVENLDFWAYSCVFVILSRHQSISAFVSIDEDGGNAHFLLSFSTTQFPRNILLIHFWYKDSTVFRIIIAAQGFLHNLWSFLP